MPPTDDEDRRLAADAGAGNDVAFATLVARHRPGLVRFVRGRSGRSALAEDAVQEALVAAHRALRRGDRPTDVRAWLHTIAWRRALDLTRRERDTVPLDLVAVTTPGLEPHVVRSAELTSVVSAWSDLPARQRRALALSVIEGRSLEQIAAALGVSPGAAKSLVARGRRTLAGRMAAEAMPCADARERIDRAADRGVRLGGDVARHVGVCHGCARAHRVARLRRRVRAALLLPVGLLDRLRDLAVVGTTHEPQVQLVTKLCATACIATLAGGAGTASLVAIGPGAQSLGPPVDAATLERIAMADAEDRAERAAARALSAARRDRVAAVAAVARPAVGAAAATSGGAGATAGGGAAATTTASTTAMTVTAARPRSRPASRPTPVSTADDGAASADGVPPPAATPPTVVTTASADTAG